MIVRSVHRFLAPCLGIALLGIAASARAQDTPGVNDAPRNVLPSPAPDTAPQTPVTFSTSVTDPDVGAGTMDMEIDLADHANVLPAAQVGTFTWAFGTNVTSDVATAGIIAINNALQNITFMPAAGFAGQARVVFEIDDNGNTGTGGERSHTAFMVIDVCTPAELGTAACATNDAPDLQLPVPAPATTRGVNVAVPLSASDPDVGAGTLDMEIDISDPDGVGPLTPASVGTFTWTFGVGVTSDVATVPLSALNTALAGFVFNPNPSFIGTARLVFEVDDNANSGSGGERSRTRFIDIVVAPLPGEVRFVRGCVATFGEGIAAVIQVERVGGSDGAASVQLFAQDDTALQGSDYNLPGSGLMSWNAGTAGVRSALIEFLDDGQVEPTERLQLFLDNASGAALGEPSVQTAWLRDVSGAGLVHSDGFEGGCVP